jgi:hypothetical protein
VRYIIAVSALLVAGCASGVRESPLPEWVAPVVAETSTPVQLQGTWSLDASLSDDPQPLIRRAVDSLKKTRRAVIAGNPPATGAGRRVSVGEGPDAPAQRDPYGDAAVSDPRLAALRAQAVAIEQNERELRFTFENAVSVVYPVGQATSADRNINLTFADWEGSQFVVEKNGPDGLVLERWILSPDGSRLYLAVSLEVKLPDFPLPEGPVVIGRMFNRESR